MLSLLLEKHLIWSRPDGRGGVTTLYYYDEITWVVGALALAWLLWFLLSRYRRARALRRPARRSDYRLLKRVVKIKRELSSRYLRPGFSNNIHAVGVGRLVGSGAYCIQIFVNDADEEMWPGSGPGALPGSYRGMPLVLVEMPAAGFLSDASLDSPVSREQYANGIRGQQEVIVGGISGANANLKGQSGTIGYFCTRRSRLPRRKEIYLLSNSHVFVDLRKAKVDDGDLIMQPSPGETASNRPIGALVNFAALNFDRDLNEPNHVDAAIAKLWEPQRHKPVIPLIGAIKGYVPEKEIQIGETARKFGRTTGYTEGHLFSIYLDIWIRYDRTGRSAFFQDQLLIEPALPEFPKFVAKGDSGSLAVDARQHAIGLIFAGMSEAQSEAPKHLPDREAAPNVGPSERPKRVENYGVANPISKVLDGLKIELLV